jgi:cysteine synthase A
MKNNDYKRLAEKEKFGQWHYPELLSPERERIYKEIENKVGNTPLYEIEKIEIPNKNKIFAKEEYLNPTGSNFDRIYPYLFKVAEKKGYIIPGVTPVIEATTGNAGASFAWVAKELGFKDVTVIIHEDAPKSRIEQIKSYGAKILFSPAGQYTKGYVELLEKVLKEDKEKKGGKIGENPTRLYAVTKILPEARLPYYKLADEAYEQLTKREGEDANFDYFISVVGSGTYISGVGERLKEINPKIKIIAIEPAESPALSALKEGKILYQEKMPHNMFGAIPFSLPKEKLNINFDIIDEIRQIKSEEWQKTMKLLYEKEGKKVGRSSAAELAVALEIAREEKDKNILITFHDPSWKYEESYEPDKFKI